MRILLAAILMCISAVSVFAEDRPVFKNYYTKKVGKPSRYYPRGSVIINSHSYSFKLVRKINNKNGIFIPVRSSYWATTRDGEARNTTYEQSIIITGRDLTHVVDGDSIPLKKSAMLWSIGTSQRPNGKTYRVFSFDKTAKVPPELNNDNAQICPYCNGTGRIKSEKSF